MWDGGLGIWGAIALAAVVGAWRVRRHAARAVRPVRHRYSAFRIFEESLRVDPSEHFLGLRLNMYIASAVALAGAAWFWHTQRRPRERSPCAQHSAAVRPASAGQERQ